MKHIIWLSALISVVLFTGGCKQQETAPPAPKPEPVAAAQQEPATQLQPPPVVADTTPPPTATIIPAPPAPVKVVPIEKEKVPPTTTVQPTPVAPAPVKVVPIETEKVPPTTTVQPTPVASVPETPAVKPAPPIVIYKATNGNVSFDHQQHAANSACSSCHSTAAPAKIILGKDKAHQLCKGCHQQQGVGPTQCTGCHKK